MNSLSHLKNREIINKVQGLVGKQRECMSLLIYHLIELDKRQLHLSLGYSGLFAYLSKNLKFSEGSAWRYTQAVKVGIILPEVINLLKEGQISLCNLAQAGKKLLSEELTSTEKVKLLDELKGKTKSQVEKLLAPKVKNPPKEKVQTLIFDQEPIKPQARLQKTKSKEKKKNEAPIKVVLKKLTFTVSESSYKKLERAKEVLSNKYPKGASTSEIFEEALELLLEKKCPKRKEKRTKKRATKTAKTTLKTTQVQRKALPEKVKQQVLKRDHHQCSYTGIDGIKCKSNHNLQIDHILPLALGGNDEMDNLRTLCQQHNLWEAKRLMGKDFIYKQMARETSGFTLQKKLSTVKIL